MRKVTTEECKHDDGWLVYSVKSMEQPKMYDPLKKDISTHYVKMVCRMCGFVIYGGGCIYLPDALDFAIKTYPPKSKLKK
jgi:hypothetical protein